MARIRTVKPDFFDDEKLATISRDARLLFIGLLVCSDDYGVVKGHPVWLKSKIFPYDDLSQICFNDFLSEIESIGIIKPFVAHGEKYYFIKNFQKHQVINRPSASRNPQYIENTNDISSSDGSLNTHGVLSDESVPEGKGREKEIYTPLPPTGGMPEKNLQPPDQPKKKKRISELSKEQLESFGKFWSIWPKKVAQMEAEKAWMKIDPQNGLVEEICLAVERFKKTDDWKKNGGKYIPYPATWLNNKRWRDELEVTKPEMDLSMWDDPNAFAN